MARQLRRRLTFANVCSFIALVVALGTGGAYAANTIGSDDIIDDSIQSVDIKNGQAMTADLGGGAVTSSKIAANAVNSSRVANESLRLSDIAGAATSGNISLSGIPNGRCSQVTINVGGAQVGDSPIVTTGASIQNGIVLYPNRVASAGHVEVNACNFSGTSMTAIRGFPARIVTFRCLAPVPSDSPARPATLLMLPADGAEPGRAGEGRTKAPRPPE